MSTYTLPEIIMASSLRQNLLIQFRQLIHFDKLVAKETIVHTWICNKIHLINFHEYMPDKYH